MIKARAMFFNSPGRVFITLCGSTRFREQFNDAQFQLTINGIIYLSLGSFLHSDTDPEISAIIKERLPLLDALHKDKIKLSDAIMVIDVPNEQKPLGYVGEATTSEILYAQSLNKPVFSYMRTKKEGSFTLDGLKEFNMEILKQ